MSTGLEAAIKLKALVLRFYKNNPSDTVSWVVEGGDGEMRFSFDGKKIYNLFADYPWKLTPEEKRIFDEENPFWAEFFEDREQA